PDASRGSDRKDSTPQLRQETSALRYFNRAYVSLASSTTEAGEATRHALPLFPESDGRPLRCDPPLECSHFTNQAIERRRRVENVSCLTLPLSKTYRFETAQRFSQSGHRQLARSRANREHHGTLAFQYRNKLWANLLQCLPVGVDFAGKARPSDASAILLELALDDKAGRAVGKRERGGLAMSNADVL